VAPVNDQLVIFRRDGSEITRLDMSLESDAEVLCANAAFKPGTPAKVILGLPVYSPDGRTVVVAAYCSNADANANPQNQYARLYRVSVESGVKEPLELSANLRYLASPGFSPDGNRIAQWSADHFGMCPPENFLGVADLDSGEVEEVTLPAFEELRQQQATGDIFGGPVGYDWSPDGSALAVSFEAGICDTSAATPLQTALSGLYILKMDGSPEELLVEGPAQSPAWSPSGRYIAYVTGASFSETEPRGIHLLDLTSREVVDLTQGSSPAWQPRP
jgi:Tol biopolymer transport system component